MARIRSIKPEFWTDEKVVSMTPLARLMFIGMWNFVDDEGRAEFSPLRLKMQILPADGADVSEIIGEIRREKLINVYTVDGKEYFEIVNFAKHQKVDARRPSKLPPPPSRDDPRRIAPTDQGKGRDQGKEKDADAGASHPDPTDDERDLFTKGKALLGQSAGGMISKLLKAKGGSVHLARAAIETAATKQDPREYIGRIIAGAPTAEGQRERVAI